jgi:hypothetical protein
MLRKKEAIDKNVDHMNLRKISLYGSVYKDTINLSTVTFGSFSGLHNTASCTCRL